MNLPRVVVTSFIALSVFGCSKDASDQSEAKAKLSTLQKKSIDITDRAVCKGKTPRSTSLLSNDWAAQHLLKSGVVVERTMSFTKKAVSVKVNARHGESTKEINVSSKSDLGKNEFLILEDDSAEAFLPIDDGTFRLSFSLSRATVGYSFVGPCLKIAAGEEALILIPTGKRK